MIAWRITAGRIEDRDPHDGVIAKPGDAKADLSHATINLLRLLLLTYPNPVGSPSI